MRAAPTVIATGLVLWLTAPAAHALGFGRVVNATQLGQPLNFAATLRLEGDEALARECVTADVLVGENRLQPNQLRVTLEPGAEPGERNVRITSSTLVDEPVVTVNVSIGCGSHITRKFVAFVDPPLINLAQGGGAAAEPAPNLTAQRVDSQVAPLTDIVPGNSSGSTAVPPESRGGMRVPPRPSRSRALAAAAPGGSGRAGVAASSVAPKPAAERLARANRMAAAPRPATRGPRLQLEAAPSVAERVAAAASDSAMGSVASSSIVDAAVKAAFAAAAASAASAADAAGQQLAKERARLQALEDGITQLRSESQASQKALAALQVRLNQAESERYANPLVYALAWLSALLAVAVAALWWRQSRQQGNAQWWSAPAPNAGKPERPARAGEGILREPISAPQVFATGPDVAGASYEASPVFDPPRPAPAAAAPVVAPVMAAVPSPVPDREARELSVEELIDLEQQAEFFIVLGQDDAAIELLMSHVRSSGGISPLPHLKLLEIYRRRGDVEAYQRIRERFNRRFNAYAPDWESDLQQGRSLEDYPAVMQQLTSLWSGPERTMEHLDGLLFRRTQDGETFELPAYRELLFLYSIARDLAEQDASRPGADVDLLLPIGEPDHGPISQLMTATSSLDARPLHTSTLPLDVDVSFGHGTGAGSGAKRYAPDSGFINLNELGDPGRGGGKR
ncbi:MAG TPA: hypothetical protein VIO33_18275 [Burkholderiaceae bacterium]